MNTSPLVTVAMSFKNPGHLVAHAIASVFCQTYPHWELILINDGSRDEALGIARKIRDQRVSFHDFSENRGLAHRLNQVTQLARGKYIATMDADDMMHPERLEKQVRYLEENETVDVVGSYTYLMACDGRVWIKTYRDSTRRDPAAAFWRIPVLHGTMMARLDWHKRFPYDESYKRGQDGELLLRASFTSNYANIPEPLYFYRVSRNAKKTLGGFLSIFRMTVRYGPKCVGIPQTLIKVGYLSALYALYFLRLNMIVETLKRKRTIHRTLTPGQRSDADEAVTCILGQSLLPEDDDRHSTTQGDRGRAC